MKKSILIFTVLIAFQISLKAQFPLQDSLKAHYTFTGNANDESGNGNNDTFFDNASLTISRFGNNNAFLKKQI